MYVVFIKAIGGGVHVVKCQLLGALSSEFHSTGSTSESPQKQEELKKRKQKTEIVEREKMKGENKVKRGIKL